MNKTVVPPENLVIYEVQGAPDPDGRPLLGPGFLGFWIESGYTFFFFDQEADDHLGPFLAADAGLKLRCVHRMKYSQWQDGARFSPFVVGPLTIGPAWSNPPLEPGENLIVIDPGLAFGYGGHPTTRACLEALARVARGCRPERVLDLGAGAGILALAAARLGASQVRAVEYSHLAADAARANVARNGLDEKVEVIRGLAEDHLDYPADLVLSNLHYQVQEAILEQGGFDGRRHIILSGLFHEEGRRLEDALVARGLRLVDRVRDDRWTTLLMRAD
ncbi:MAG: 50S ribosomal protein L11 methyltransferase [Pseudomonadota bacterium]